MTIREIGNSILDFFEEFINLWTEIFYMTTHWLLDTPIDIMLDQFLKSTCAGTLWLDRRDVTQAAQNECLSDNWIREMYMEGTGTWRGWLTRCTPWLVQVVSIPTYDANWF